MKSSIEEPSDLDEDSTVEILAKQCVEPLHTTQTLIQTTEQILNRPVTNEVDTNKESVDRYEPDRDLMAEQNARLEITEVAALGKATKKDKVNLLNAPIISTSEYAAEEEAITDEEEENEMLRVNLSVLNDQNLEVGVVKTQKTISLNMAQQVLDENIVRETDEIREGIAVRNPQYQNATEIGTSSLLNTSNRDLKRVKLDSYACPKQVIEISEANTCNQLEQSETMTNSFATIDQILTEPEVLQTAVQPKKTQIFSQAQTNDLEKQFSSAENFFTQQNDDDLLSDQWVSVKQEPDRDLTYLEEIDSRQPLRMPAWKHSEFKEEILHEFQETRQIEFPSLAMTTRETSQSSSNEAIRAMKVNLLSAPKLETSQHEQEQANEFYEAKIIVEKIVPHSEQSVLNKSRDISADIELLNAPICEEINISNRLHETTDEFYEELKTEHIEPRKELSMFQTSMLHSIETISLLNAPKSELTPDEELSASEFYDLPVHFEHIEPRQEHLLNSKPDKKLLLWLSYPQISSQLTNLDEETRDLDEKLDYLYERIGLDRHADPSLDNNLLRIEKILSLFISNQENVEFQEEILKCLPCSRPELQKLILDRQMALEVEEACELCEAPIKYSSCVKKDISFSEDSIDELSDNDNAEPYILEIKREPPVLNTLATVQNLRILPREDEFANEIVTIDHANSSLAECCVEIEKEPLKVLNSTSLVQCETFSYTEVTSQHKHTSSPIPMGRINDETSSWDLVAEASKLRRDPRSSNSLNAVNQTYVYNIENKSMASYLDEEFEFVMTNQLRNQQNDQRNNNNEDEFQDTANENTLSMNLEDAGLFYEQVELIEDQNTNVCNSTVIHNDLNCLVEQSEINKWNTCDRLINDNSPQNLNFTTTEKCFTPIEIKLDHSDIGSGIDLNESENDENTETTTSSSSGLSDTSGKVHLIESVEVVTHHNCDEDGQTNDTSNDQVHIHKVDINRLKIKEKRDSKDKMSNEPRFKVNFKQEEMLDLRGKLTDEEKIDLSTNKIFAKKFVEQIIKLSSKKLASIEGIENNTEADQQPMTSKAASNQNKYFENIDLNNISNKTTSEILESLNNLKEDFGKHISNSLIKEEESIEEEIECFGDFSKRLHSTSNFDNDEDSRHKTEIEKSINLTATDSNEFKVSQC